MLLTRRRLLWPQVSSEEWPGLRVHPRSDWTEARPAGPLEPEDVRFLLVHHTAGNTHHDESSVPGILQGIRAFHVSDKGWPDIAYNFLIDRYGGVWEGRFGSLKEAVRGDATGGNQGFSQLVCLIGDFTSETPTEEALDALTSTLAWLADRYSIDTQPGAVVEFVSLGSNRWPEGSSISTPPIAGHRDMSQTSCPGDALYPLLAERIGPAVHQIRQGRRATTTSSSTTTPDTTSSTTTVPSTTATSAPTTTSTASVTTLSSPTSTEAALASAATTSSRRNGLALPLVSIVAGALVAVVGWRARRMSRSG